MVVIGPIRTRMDVNLTEWHEDQTHLPEQISLVESSKDPRLYSCCHYNEVQLRRSVWQIHWLNLTVCCPVRVCPKISKMYFQSYSYWWKWWPKLPKPWSYKLSLTDTELKCVITSILLKDIIFNQDSLLYLKCYRQLQQSSFFWNGYIRTRGFINKKQRIVNWSLRECFTPEWK